MSPLWRRARVRVVGREDETHGGCCIHVLHADLILTITVLERTHQFHWLLAKVRCVSSFLDKKKNGVSFNLHDRSRYRLDRLALGRVCLGNSIFFLEHFFFFFLCWHVSIFPSQAVDVIEVNE